MTNQAEREHINTLIAGDRLDDAIERLETCWSGRHEEMHRLTLALRRRWKTLRTQQAKGVISQEDATLEHARIADALFSIAAQVGEPNPTIPTSGEQPARRAFPGWAWAALAAVCLFAVLAVWQLRDRGQNGEDPPAPFNLTLLFHEAGEETKPIGAGKIMIRLGQRAFPARAINEEGEVIYMGIPGVHLQDSLTVVPVEMRYRVTGQSAYSPAQSDHISIVLTRLADTTLWRGTLLDEWQRPVTNAIIDIENGLAVARSDGRGNFQAAVPLPAGEQVQVTVSVDGIRRRNARYTLSESVGTTIIIGNYTQRE
jgi:hypothetical protein